MPEERPRLSVAVIQSEKAWCIDHDGVYNFLVRTHGEGHGNYVFRRLGAKGLAVKACCPESC